MDHGKFLIKAHAVSDLEVISALLQDSIFHRTFHSFHTDKKCLRILLNRFCWEYAKQWNDKQHHHGHGNDAIAVSNSNNVGNDCDDGDDSRENAFFRVHCGLFIYHVESVTMNENFSNDNDGKFLNLLAIQNSKDDILDLHFSGHRILRVKIGKLQVYMKDLHDKYPALSCPQHAA